MWTMTMSLPRVRFVYVAILIFGTFLTFINIYQLREMQLRHLSMDTRSMADPGQRGGSAMSRQPDAPLYWLKAKNTETGYLDHVVEVFQRTGYAAGTERDDWAVLWHHDYPFMEEAMKPILLNLKPHQRVNHIPGSGFYTSKVNLATSQISAIPPAFKLPEEKHKFLEFTKFHPDKLWVQKSNRHRGILIQKVEDLNLEEQNSFIQEYISNPLLIDKRKFDIGIYVMITSVKPLRVYMLAEEVLIRFCPKDYHPFDPKDVDKYVVGDSYTPTWQIPELKQFYSDNDATYKGALNAYIRKLGKDPEQIWRQVRKTIQEVMQASESNFLSLAGKYRNSARNFFELSRFDFVIDEELKVFLMEANMSPNLSSSHFPANRLLYEQVLFNLFSLVGIASHLHGTRVEHRSEEENEMLVSNKDVAVYVGDCATEECQGCSALKCKLCSRCQTTSLLRSLKDAYLEHINRVNTRRVIPAPLTTEWIASESKFQDHVDRLETEGDKIQAWWFRGKCLADPTWCL